MTTTPGPLAAYDADDDPDLDTIIAAATEGEPFRIENDRMATWAMRKRAEHTAAILDVHTVADAELHRIDTWMQQATAPHTRAVAFFDAILTDYARRERTEHDRKTVTTPYGAIKSRTVKASAVIADRDAVVAWLKANGHADLVATVEVAPTATALVEAGVITVTDDGTVLDPATGEVIPEGLLTAKPASVSVKVEGT